MAKGKKKGKRSRRQTQNPTFFGISVPPWMCGCGFCVIFLIALILMLAFIPPFLFPAQEGGGNPRDITFMGYIYNDGYYDVDNPNTLGNPSKATSSYSWDLILWYDENYEVNGVPPDTDAIESWECYIFRLANGSEFDPNEVAEEDLEFWDWEVDDWVSVRTGKISNYLTSTNTTLVFSETIPEAKVWVDADGDPDTHDQTFFMVCEFVTFGDHYYLHQISVQVDELESPE